jgi:geranylgeranyl reductase
VDERVEVLIIGGGPGGLVCAADLAAGGVRVLLVERKAKIGGKVCAGGITWNGLIRLVPETLIEAAFPEQHIVTGRQRTVVAEANPIVATVNRERLGQWMAQRAAAAGADLRTGCRVLRLDSGSATLEDGVGRQTRITFDFLVGADGSNSLVRRWLGLPVRAMGLGLNAMRPRRHARMEWHLRADLFGCGYGWVFPHAEDVSVGAYTAASGLSGRVLKERLLAWAAAQGMRIDPDAIRAGLVNFDYRGVRFDRTFLVGDAAGLASGLTGEGIHPALISGRAVARLILDPAAATTALDLLVRHQRRHRRLVALAGPHRRFCGLLMETLVVLLRLKILDFRALEMAR